MRSAFHLRTGIKFDNQSRLWYNSFADKNDYGGHTDNV